jgi:hypothetical protein
MRSPLRSHCRARLFHWDAGAAPLITDLTTGLTQRARRPRLLQLKSRVQDEEIQRVKLIVEIKKSNCSAQGEVCVDRINNYKLPTRGPSIYNLQSD